jgi:hypothetical protein
LQEVDSGRAGGAYKRRRPAVRHRVSGLGSHNPSLRPRNNFLVRNFISTFLRHWSFSENCCIHVDVSVCFFKIPLTSVYGVLPAGNYACLWVNVIFVDHLAVHTVLLDLLPASSYFRFNPYMSEDFLLDEIRAAKWDQMKQDTEMYCRKNEQQLECAVRRLVQPKPIHNKAIDWLRLQRDKFS